MNIVLQPTNFSHGEEDYGMLFSSEVLAGSPHAILDEAQLCIESPILLEEVLETNYYRLNPFLDRVFCPIHIDSNKTHSTSNKP